MLMWVLMVGEEAELRVHSNECEVQLSCMQSVDNEDEKSPTDVNMMKLLLHQGNLCALLVDRSAEFSNFMGMTTNSLPCFLREAFVAKAASQF